MVVAFVVPVARSVPLGGRKPVGHVGQNMPQVDWLCQSDYYYIRPTGQHLHMLPALLASAIICHVLYLVKYIIYCLCIDRLFCSAEGDIILNTVHFVF